MKPMHISTAIATATPHLIMAMATFLLAGCVSPSPNLDSQFGSSLNTLKAQQTIDPGASGNSNMVQVDAKAARDAVATYNASFRAPAPTQNVFNIGIGNR